VKIKLSPNPFGSDLLPVDLIINDCWLGKEMAKEPSKTAAEIITDHILTAVRDNCVKADQLNRAYRGLS
jgi:hypothetical protein